MQMVGALILQQDVPFGFPIQTTRIPGPPEPQTKVYDRPRSQWLWSSTQSYGSHRWPNAERPFPSRHTTGQPLSALWMRKTDARWLTNPWVWHEDMATQPRMVHRDWKVLQITLPKFLYVFMFYVAYKLLSPGRPLESSAILAFIRVVCGGCRQPGFLRFLVSSLFEDFLDIM